MSITIDIAREIRGRRRAAENVVFEKLWEKLDSQIRLVSAHADDMNYRVPMYVFGLPRYDQVKVATRMRVRLRNRGFKVAGDDETPTIQISWEREKKKRVPKRKGPTTTTPALTALSNMRRQVDINKTLGWD